jgi:ABC-type transport system involved in multi-copper enzyme maturation permease subunit
MKLNLDSRIARLYRWYYNINEYMKDIDMPKSLCPYFWKLVWMWLTIIPLTLFTLIFEIVNHFERENWGDKLKKSIIGYALLGVLYVLYLPFTLFWHTYHNGSEWITFIALGCFIWFIIICCLIISGISKLYKFIKVLQTPTTTNKNEEPNIVAEFIKAKYNKYCPKIDWN